MDKHTALLALKAVIVAIVDTVREVPEGAPEGAIRLAMQNSGATPAQCSEIVNTLVKVGQLKRRGNLLFSA